MADEIPAGWYPNPHNSAEELYWSGAEWTGISRTVAVSSHDDAVNDFSASEIEESTVMRPVRGAAQASEAPFGAPGASVAESGLPTQVVPVIGVTPAAPPATSAPQYVTPQYAAPPEPSAYAAPVGAPAARGFPTPSTGGLPTQGSPASGPVSQAFPTPFSTQGPPTQAFSTASLPPSAPSAAITPDGPGAVSWPADPGAYAGAPDASSIRWALGGAPLAPQANPRAKLGMIAMIVGIVGCVLAIIPGASLAAWIPAFVAIALGIVSFLGGKPRTLALAGIITGGAALAVGTGVSIWFLVALAHG